MREDWSDLKDLIAAISITLAFLAILGAGIYGLVSYIESRCTEGDIYDGKICENHRMRHINLKDLEKYPSLGGAISRPKETVIVPVVTSY